MNATAPPCEHQDDWAIEAILFGGVEAKADAVCLHDDCGWQGRVPLFPELTMEAHDA